MTIEGSMPSVYKEIITISRQAIHRMPKIVISHFYLEFNVIDLHYFNMVTKNKNCPVCNRIENVIVYDKGYKYFIRMITFNNRLVCTKCHITWRKQTPYGYAPLHPSEVSHRGYDK